MGTTSDKAVLGRALEIARTLDLNPRIQDMRGLRKYLKFSTQRFNNWKRRGVPIAGVILLSERLGASVEALRGEPVTQEQEQEKPVGGEMTDQEAMLLTAFRLADEQFRLKFEELVRQVIMAPFRKRAAQPPPEQAKARIA